MMLWPQNHSCTQSYHLIKALLGDTAVLCFSFHSIRMKLYDIILLNPKQFYGSKERNKFISIGKNIFDSFQIKFSWRAWLRIPTRRVRLAQKRVS